MISIISIILLDILKKKLKRYDMISNFDKMRHTMDKFENIFNKMLINDHVGSNDYELLICYLKYLDVLLSEMKIIFGKHADNFINDD